MRDLIRRKQPQIQILFGFILFYFAIVGIIKFSSTSISAIKIAFLTISFGFAPAYYFRNEFKFKNIVGWILHAGTLGLLFIPFLFLFLGWLNLNFIFEYSVLFLFFCSLIGLLTLFFVDEAKVKPNLTVKGIDKFDLLIGAIYLAFTTILTLQNLQRINIHWDSFTFWGLDAKYIFENNHLRDQVFHSDVINFKYTSFHPIFHSIIYDIYGGVFEQFAAWINVYINFLAMLLVYFSIPKRTLVHRSLVATGVLIVSYSAITVVYLLSLHADVLNAFFLLVFFLVLTNDSNRSLGTYWQRILLLLFLSVSFYFTKSPFLYFSLILIAITVLYEFEFLIANRNRLFKNVGFLLSVLSVTTVWVMRALYFANIGGNNNLENKLLKVSFTIEPTLLNSLPQYLVELTQYMVEMTPYLLGLWWLTLLSIFFVKEINKNYLYLFISTLLLFLIPLVFYAVKQHNLKSESLPRYTAMVMYLFPLVISYSDIVETKLRRIISYGILLLMVLIVFLNIMWPMPLSEKFEISEGSYQSELTKYHQYAEKVVNLAGADARIVIMDDSGNQIISNKDVPAIFLRYFMMDHSVGGQYRIPASDLEQLSDQSNANYFLLLSYVDAFEGCEQLLSNDRAYLIDISVGDFSSEPGSCLFSEFELIELGGAIH